MHRIRLAIGVVLTAAAACTDSGKCPTTPSGCGAVSTLPSITKVEGDNQSGPTGALLSDSLAVRVSSGGSPTVGAVVRWTTTTPDGVVTPAENMTNGQGIARTKWRLGLAAGTQTVTVTSDRAVGSVSFSATAVQPTAAASRRRFPP